jgi:putative hydrolase of the HAD superfamily
LSLSAADILLQVERSLSPRVVVFDLGGVLVPPEGSIGDLAAELGVGHEALSAAYWRVRDDYDRGGPSAEFWEQVTAEVGRRVGRSRFDRLDAIDAARWSSLTVGVESLLAEVTRARVPLAVLSNAPVSLAATVRAAPWSLAFRTLLFSSDVGVMKPEPAIYVMAADLLDVPSRQIAFFDDRQPNVDGALDQGWQAHLWTGPSDARRILARHGRTAVHHR